jgi:serine/threonine-protein kinase HipA
VSSKVKTVLDVCVGKSGALAGRLAYAKDGAREFSSFAYDASWLTHPDVFALSSDQPLDLAVRTRKGSKSDSCFFFALADTEPDAWGRRVIARAHAKRRKGDPELGALSELDYLCAVDDFSRVGALRLRDAKGQYLATVEEGKRTTPPLVELEKMMNASRAVERGRESMEDLRYLQGKGTSLGGMRPKCTLLDADGTLAIGKFPSISDERSVTRGEVLALKLACSAGIDTAAARVTEVDGTPVAVIARFDRNEDFGRIPYQSAASMLQALREEEHAYTEVLEAIVSCCLDAKASCHQLWRRLVFNHLITNVDDHLQNLGFLHVRGVYWRLAPAFDLNPFPDKDRESKTWLSEDTGPITSIQTLMDLADRFMLTQQQARAILADVVKAVSNWRVVARSAEVGFKPAELEDFAPAFEHGELNVAKALLK